jgi:2-hydroxychromene-2-carboxylate isomerase
MSAERRIVFYLDFISPFAYLANARLPAIAARHGATIDYRPMDVMHAKLAAGNFAPSTRAVAAKARFIRRDRLGWAERYGVPMTDPKAFRAPRLNSGLLLAADLGRAQAYADAAFHRVWGLGGDPDDDALLSAVAADIGIDARTLLDHVRTPEAQARYRALQQEAYARGVFGVPMMMVGDQMFWGNDRLDFLEECLSAEPAGT